ncbi:MAG: TraV family lipoprotein, partial [Syntrophorhabdales bacterium]
IQVEETMYRSILAVLSIALLAACSTAGNAINPYKSNFNCPYKESGKCISMTGAYNESRAGKIQPMNPSKGAVFPTTSEAAYQESVYKKLAGLLEEPKTPLIAPPKVMRVLLLPYKNDRDLYMYRYAYFVVDDFRWVLDGNPAAEGK